MRVFLIALIVVFLIGSIFSFIPPVSGLHYFQGFLETEIDNSDDSNKDGHLTRPTFGSSHENNNKVVDYGFKLNDQKFFLSDNYHTPFVEQPINIGERNTFEATVFSEKGLLVQEFLFGIPEIGEAHHAELGIEVWFNYDGEIKSIKAVQQTDVIDEDHIFAIHGKTKCRSYNIEEKCDTTRISVMFLEPLKDNIMAIKAIDYKNRYQITYLNEGIDVSGKSLNPMQTTTIPSPIKNEGPITVTQIKKYSILWMSEDGRIFERNTYGSFKQINHSFERFQDSGEPLTRNHSDFGVLLKYEQTRAVNVFNSTNLESELPETFAYTFPEQNQRINEKIKLTMMEQEKIAQKILEDSQVQARYSKHSRS
jgi:hypothetical protein